MRLTTGFRLAAPAGLLVAAAAATQLRIAPLSVLAAGSLVAHGVLGRRARHVPGAGIPLVLFAAAVAVLQWFHGGVDWVLPLRTVAVFLLTTLAMRIAPWVWFAGRLSPRSRFYLPVLFLLFVRHFTEILISESRRTLQARALSAPSLFRAGGFSSVTNAVAAIFGRALTRAERFYAAQSLNGIGQ
jgi:hypothetical protein